MKLCFDDVHRRIYDVSVQVGGMVTKGEFNPFKKDVENRMDVFDEKLDTVVDLYKDQEKRVVRLEQKFA